MLGMQDDVNEQAAAGRGFAQVHEATTLLRAILQVSDEFEAALGRELTVNRTDLDAMQRLIMRGPQSPTELARALDISGAAVTTVIDRLTALGHASRVPNPDDRRGVIVVPSEASVGRAIAALMPMIVGIDRVIHEFDPEQQAAITEYLRRVVEVYRRSMPGTA